jgi:hypothetical protein
LAAPNQRARRALSERLRRQRRDRRAVRRAARRRLGAAEGVEDRDRPAASERGRRRGLGGCRGRRPGRLLELLDRARAEYATSRELYGAAGGADRLQDTIGAAEAAATRIAKYQPVLVLGIVQTADYAREMLRLPGGPADSGAGEDEIGRMIASRLRRQALLHEPGREITLLMGEGALRTRVASPETMHAQREHIARLAETLTTATVAIVPFGVQAPIATLHGWALRDDLATIETDGGDLEIADPEQVERYWRNTQLLLEAAATGHDAAALCRRINAEIAATRDEPAE